MSAGGLVAPEHKNYQSIQTEIAKTYTHVNRMIADVMIKAIDSYTSDELKQEMYQMSRPITEDITEKLKKCVEDAVQETRSLIRQGVASRGSLANARACSAGERV